MAPVERGIHQGCPPNTVLGVHFHPRFEQKANTLEVAFERGNHQGRPAKLVFGVLFSPHVEQEANALEVPFERGNHQIRPAKLVSDSILVGEEEGLRDAFGLSAANELCLWA